MSTHTEFVKWPVEHAPSWTGVWPTAVGYHGCPPHRRRDGFDFYCPHLITRGQVRVGYRPEESVLLGPGDGFNVFPGVPYGYERQEEDVHCYWVRLTGPLAGGFLAAMGFTLDRSHFRVVDPDLVAACFDELLLLARGYGRDGDPRTMEVLHRMLRGYGYCPEAREAREPFAERVRDFMEHELDRGLNIEQISRAFQVSRSTLFLQFKKAFGQSPMEVLQELRAARARRLLRETSLPVREVAQSCGYSDPLYFTRDFTRRQGSSPTAFRSSGAGA